MKNLSEVKKIDLANGNYKFSVSEIVSEGWDLFKKEWGLFLVFGLLIIIVFSLSSQIPYIGYILTNLLVTPLMIIGFASASHIVATNGRLDFNDFFIGIDRIGEFLPTAALLLLMSILSFIPFLICILFFGLYGDLYLDPFEIINKIGLISILLFISVLPIILVPVLYTWTFYLFTFYDLKNWEALETSRKIVASKIGVHIVFYFAIIFISIIGLLGFCLGIFISFPAIMTISYAGFSQITGLKNDNEGLQIEDHLITP